MSALPQFENDDNTPDRQGVAEPVCGTPKLESQQAGYAGNAGNAGNAKEDDLSATQHRRFIESSITTLLAHRQALMISVLAGFSDQSTLHGALLSTANTLHQRFACQRVSIALLHQGRLRIETVSQQACLEQRSGETELLAAVMQEALDEDALTHINLDRPSPGRLRAHRLLNAGQPDIQIISVPICHADKAIGALCIERRSQAPLAASTLVLIEQITSVLAPLVELRQKAERKLGSHVQDTVKSTIGLADSPRRLKTLFAGAACVTVLVLAAVVQVAHTIDAKATLVPVERRVITAPRNGYITAVEVGAGDKVVLGDVLLVLDTQDLILERTHWNNELASNATEMRAAMAINDRKQMAMLHAAREQSEAQLALTEAQLMRSALKAPSDGVIVSGELAQMTGAPVERGQSLLELAPPDGYRVHLMIDETDIADVHQGDTGSLSLNAIPGQALDFVVDTIHPIGIAENGKNQFRVEALLDDHSNSLHPGQTGLGKIYVGQANLLWVWTHEFVDWAKQKYWEWLG